MQPPADTAFIAVPSPAPNRSPIAWMLVVVQCLFFIWLAVGITPILPIFSQLFASIGIDLPLPTRMLLSSNLWFVRTLFAAAAILAIARRVVNFNRLQLRVINVALILIGGVLPLIIVALMYLPLFLLIGKLKGAH